MAKRLSPSQIKKYLDAVIERAKESEPLLSKRLVDLKKWIAQKKDGLLMSKIQILDLLTEIILDSELWLNLLELSSKQREILYKENEFDLADSFWIETLFPLWFQEQDPQSPKWKQQIMAGNFNQNDETIINDLQDEIEILGGSSLWRYILDLSMATDILVVGHLEKPICVQLTTISGQWLEEKKLEWEQLLKYWKITRGLLVSYYPKALIHHQLANLILNESDALPHICYTKRSL